MKNKKNNYLSNYNLVLAPSRIYGLLADILILL